jgi:ankyrin repeat protein
MKYIKLLENYPFEQGENTRVKGDLLTTLLAEIESRRPNSEIIFSIINDPNFDINAVGENGYTPLMAACMWDHLDIVQELLQNPEININAQNEDGMTALMVAAEVGRMSIVRELLSHPEIDPEIKENKWGYTAWDMAHPEIRNEFPMF